MAKIVDVRSTIWRWVGPVAPMPPHFSTSASDILDAETGSIAGFRFLGWLVVEIECDDGTIGIGNAALSPAATKVVVDTYLKPLLIGADPMNSEYLWQSMYRRTLPFGRKGIGMAAISAVDLAIWDLKGKLLNQPVFRLLGGRTKPALQVYASRLYSQQDEPLHREAKAYAEQGFGAVKLRFGWGPRDGLAGMERNVNLVRVVRDAVGPNVDIMADCYMGWSVEYARRMLRLLEPHNLRWLEEPLIADDLEGYAELRSLGRVAIAGGEHEFTLAGFRHALSLKAFDVVQFDVNRVGGITPAKKIADMCEAHDIPVIPHAGQMHNYHLSMASMASPMSEYFPKVAVEVGNELFWYIFDGEPVARDGKVDLDDNLPGFGLVLRIPDPAEFDLQT